MRSFFVYKAVFEIAQSNFQMVNSNDTVLKKIISGDESWVYGYYSETKQFTVEALHRQDQKKHVSHNNVAYFFDCEGVVHYEYQ